jgi:hypothetical protein
VTPAALQRQVALAAAALLSGLLVVAFQVKDDDVTVPAPPPPPAAVEWQTARVGVFGRSADGRTTSCGVTLDSSTLGVTHPVLPCGVKLLLSAHGHEVRTEVVEQGGSAGTAFDVTKALADELGMSGRETIRWRFAG